MSRSATRCLTGSVVIAAAFAGPVHSADRNPGSVVTAQCTITGSIFGGVRRSAQERRWKDLEKELEQPLRGVISSEPLSKEALASLDQRLLGRHGWSLTRFTVRLLRELEANDLKSARSLLKDEAYAEHALRDARWDGYTGWTVVSGVRGETLEILGGLEKIRTAGDEPERSAVPPSLVTQAQKVTERLLQAAGEKELAPLAKDCIQLDPYGSSLSAST